MKFDIENMIWHENMKSYSKKHFLQKSYFYTVLSYFSTKIFFRVLTWKYDFDMKNMNSYSKKHFLQKSCFYTVLSCLSTKLLFWVLTWKYHFWHKNMFSERKILNQKNILMSNFDLKFEILNQIWQEKYDFHQFDMKNTHPFRTRHQTWHHCGHWRTYLSHSLSHSGGHYGTSMVQHGATKAISMVQHGPHPCWPWSDDLFRSWWVLNW